MPTRRARSHYRSSIRWGILAAVLAGCGAGHLPDPSVPSHHALGGGYRNTQIDRPGRDVGMLLDLARFIGDGISHDVPAGHALPAADAAAMLSEMGSRDSITWIGHASVLVRLSGTVILVDPVYTDTVSPVPLASPPRLVPPGVPITALPGIDAVVISHNHFDHFHPETVRSVVQPRHTVCVTPLLVAQGHVLGCASVEELDWHESTEVGPVLVTALPARHNSGRGLFDLNETLWASFALRTNDTAVYLSGDSGYGAHFDAIGRRYGPFDVAIMAAGAYEPRDLVSHVHMAPEEAVQAAMDIRASPVDPDPLGHLRARPGRPVRNAGAAAGGGAGAWVSRLRHSDPGDRRDRTDCRTSGSAERSAGRSAFVEAMMIWRGRARRRRNLLAGGPGFEPGLSESESDVLPLNYPPAEGRLASTVGWRKKSISCR